MPRASGSSRLTNASALAGTNTDAPDGSRSRSGVSMPVMPTLSSVARTLATVSRATSGSGGFAGGRLNPDRTTLLEAMTLLGTDPISISDEIRDAVVPKVLAASGLMVWGPNRVPSIYRLWPAIPQLAAAKQLQSRLAWH